VFALYLTPALLLGGDPYLMFALTACLLVILERATSSPGGGISALREFWRTLLAEYRVALGRLPGCRPRRN
jgi:hypothetical protein